MDDIYYIDGGYILFGLCLQWGMIWRAHAEVWETGKAEPTILHRRGWTRKRAERFIEDLRDAIMKMGA